MGADLIGYMVRGPVKLTAAQKAKALAKAKKVHAVAVKYIAALEQGDTGEDEREQCIEELKTLGVSWQFFEDDSDIERAADLDPKKVVNTFFAFWNDPNGRDTAYRTFDEMRVVFAGDTSWGDEPGGYGYQTLKEADMLCVLDSFGVD